MRSLHFDIPFGGVLEHFRSVQLKNRELWSKFVDVYRSRPDSQNNGWRGEYWGKMMRGGVLVYNCTEDDELYNILTDTVRDMLTVADNDGRVSSYQREKEFTGWDMWCRKYVMLGCEYYLDICRDGDLKKNIIAFISGCADHIIDRIGSGAGKMEITDSSERWRGLNSSSILEPMVKLYRLTNNKKYLDFSTYIIKSGGAKEINIFKLAYEKKLYPYQYGVSKAYEMMSCFEGLWEYYLVTGIEDCKTAVVRFADAVMETELSIIGCSGITHELFDYTKARQTVRPEGVLQETCVTVTWMKLCSKLLAETKDPRYADCMEHSFYNAYLGTVNTEKNISPFIREKYMKMYNIENVTDTLLPVDSYSPLLSDRRGRCVGGTQILPDRSYYGCCACISAAGVGVFAGNAVISDDSGITVNFFEKGRYSLEYRGKNVDIIQKTSYPADGKVEITVKTETPAEFELRVRVPAWTGKASGYTVYKKVWHDDTITVEYPMPLRTEYPIPWEKAVVYVPDEKEVYHDPANDGYVAIMRGPLTLAADSRTGKDADSVFDFEPVGKLCGDKEITAGVPCMVKMKFTDKKGGDFYLVDYASAGRDWKTLIAAWLKTK